MISFHLFWSSAILSASHLLSPHPNSAGARLPSKSSVAWLLTIAITSRIVTYYDHRWLSISTINHSQSQYHNHCGSLPKPVTFIYDGPLVHPQCHTRQQLDVGAFCSRSSSFLLCCSLSRCFSWREEKLKGSRETRLAAICF